MILLDAWSAPESGAREWGTLGRPWDPNLARLVHSVETPFGTLRHALYRRGARVAHHAHDVPVLVYGVGGPCIEHSDTAQTVKRRLTYHPKGFGHSLEYQGITHVLAIESAAITAADWPPLSAPLLATLYDDVWRIMLAIAEAAPDVVVNHALLRLVSNAQASLARRAPEWIHDCIDYLHSNWEDVPSTSFLARRARVSTQHLCRSFRIFTGVTVQQYSLALRIDRARGLLWGSGAPISQVAAETGFADQSHLTRVLGLHSGKSPRNLRLLAPCFKHKLDMPDWALSVNGSLD